MKTKLWALCLALAALLTACGKDPEPLGDGSFAYPYRVGQTGVVAYSQIREGETNPLFEARVTLLEVVSSDQAAKMAAQADADNYAPAYNEQYVMAKFEMELAGPTDERSVQLGAHDFHVMSARDEREYPNTTIVAGLDPALGVVQPGKKTTGWVAFLVDAGDVPVVTLAYDEPVSFLLE